MEFYNRRLLLLNEDQPISTTTSPLPLPQDTEPTATANSSSPPESTTPSSFSSLSSLLGRPWKLPTRPVFTSNVAYALIILFTAVFFLGFILLYIRQFAGDSPAEASSGSSRRRRRRHHHQRPHPSVGGVDPTTVDSLPTFPYHGGVKQQQNQDCAICLSEFQDGETVKMTPHCKHVFHPECIDAWLLSHVTCPICRCTKFCEVEGGGSISMSTHHHQHDEGGSTVENGGHGSRELGSRSRSHSVTERTARTSSGSSIGLGHTVALRRTLTY